LWRWGDALAKIGESAHSNEPGKLVPLFGPLILCILERGIFKLFVAQSCLKGEILDNRNHNHRFLAAATDIALYKLAYQIIRAISNPRSFLRQ
jgi:hypothetical protein